VYAGTTGDEVADPAVRTAQFAAGFERGTVSSVCSGDLTLPLTDIGLRAKQLMGDPCIPVALAHPATPTCQVIDSSAGGGAPMATCGSGAGDCWQLVVDPVRCPQSPDHLRVEIDRTVAPTQQHFAHISCETAP
jgi:hypothetical protein